MPIIRLRASACGQWLMETKSFNLGALLVVLAVLVSLHPFVSLLLRSELYIVPNIIAVRATRWVALFVCKP